MITNRERFLMQQAMNDADHYLNVEQWLNTVISLDGRTVEQELEHAAPKIDSELGPLQAKLAAVEELLES